MGAWPLGGWFMVALGMEAGFGFFSYSEDIDLTWKP